MGYSFLDSMFLTDFVMGPFYRDLSWANTEWFSAAMMPEHPCCERPAGDRDEARDPLPVVRAFVKPELVIKPVKHALVYWGGTD